MNVNSNYKYKTVGPNHTSTPFGTSRIHVALKGIQRQSTARRLFTYLDNLYVYGIQLQDKCFFRATPDILTSV